MSNVRNRFETVTLAAGEQRNFPIVGRSFLLLTNTIATQVQIGIDLDELENWPVGRRYREPKETDRFKQVRLKNPHASAAMTVTFVVSEGDISFDVANKQCGANISVITDKTLAATGSTGTKIVDANPDRKLLVIFGDWTMTGRAYLGPAATVSATVKMGIVTQYGQWSGKYTGALYGVGNDAAQIVCGYELY